MGATAGILSMGASTVGEFAAQQAQASAVTSRADFQSSMARIQAADVVRRGDQEANARETQAQRIQGAQRATMAANGIDPNVGSGADLQGDEAKFSALDAVTLRQNAAREAWGITTQADLNRMAAGNQAAALRTSSYSTLLTGAVRTYGLYAGNKPVGSNEKKGKTTPPEEWTGEHRDQPWRNP